jgi:hypothetical protein
MAVSKKIERKADQIAEIKKCGSDPIYFIKKYVKISHPTRGPISFETYPYQEECVKSFLTHRMIICNKSRQLGLSTVSAAYALWLALFRRDKNVIILATRLETAKLFLEKVKGMFDTLPEWLIMPRLRSVSVREMKFTNNSKIKALPCTENAARGEAVSLLIVDEAAHIEVFDEIWTGLQPTLSTGGDVILISSPKGVGNQFYNIFQRAIDNGEDKVGSNGFFGIKLPWTVHPEHDQAWFEEQCAALLDSPRAIAQELLCSFEASGFSFLDKESLIWMQNTIASVISRFGPNLEMNIWKYPEFGHKYIVSADVARGDAEDFSAAYVLDATTDEMVAEYKGRIQPDKFGEFLFDVGMKYNTAFIVNELNSPGLVTSYKLRDMKYKHLYYEKLFNGNLEPNYLPQEIENLTPGFNTTVKSRPVILGKLEAAIRNKKFENKSDRLVGEFKTFIVDNEKPKAQKNAHDDLIMALAIGVNFLEFSNKKVETGFEMAMLKAMSRDSKSMKDLKNPSWGVPGKDLPMRQSWGGQAGKRMTPQESVDVYKSFDWLLR